MAKLLDLPNEGGCTAKLPAQALEELLQGVSWGEHPCVPVGLQTGDDAGIYVLDDATGLVLTTDFFPPFCRDPFLYGEVSAANALSDVWAMGGRPLAAVNLSLFPAEGDLEPLRGILEGGAKTAARAGIPIIGGHTIANPTPVYGMAVVGQIDPGHIIPNSGLETGLDLILSDALGTGVVTTAHRLELGHTGWDEACAIMRKLNREAAQIMISSEAPACTDITGFSLLGHALRMAIASNVGIWINAAKVPLIEGALNYAQLGCIPGATFRNQEYVGERVEFNGVPASLRHLLFDPQTSGGLLFAVHPARSEEALRQLRANGYARAERIGHTTPPDGCPLRVSFEP